MKNALSLLTLTSLTLGGCAAWAEADSTPLPSQEVSIDLSGDSGRSLEDGSHVLGHPKTSSELASFTQREQVSGPVYWTWGIANTFYSFGHADDFSVHQLQSYAVPLSLEYVSDNQVEAMVRVEPGVYFEDHPTASSWDVPVEAYTGIPMTERWHGVVGLSNGRFYHHVVPIAGVVWTVNDRMTLNALYPEPSLVVKLNPLWTSSLGGELLGGGYNADSYGRDARVEYWEYRIGETVSYQFQPSWKLSAGAGYLWRRVIDLYRDAQSPEADGGLFIHLGLTYSH